MAQAPWGQLTARAETDLDPDQQKHLRCAADDGGGTDVGPAAPTRRRDLSIEMQDLRLDLTSIGERVTGLEDNEIMR
ncbi:hypothetical protein NDU88_005324 [Pleurodeles waltl]|uniref:Uncharacterized protein n=1 Tax=Pleurodeles waltl TaxID=8319 RepID=A0AAV7TC98_PLEWA|nr:hypothetical protein NDU88_005324 [Pleurodeles waltl]